MTSSKAVIKLIKADGWYEVKSNSGSHRQFRHPTKKGKVTVPHPRKDIPLPTVKSIMRQAGLSD
ncbi:Predicted RNA binding protein YcfA, dsRBD-like fold, HicA-like mRNA interferase family [Moraxella cuniculi DSM 21768]|uniref:Predicted RNA binding protein YcfA, dsRBD-like fold, HicA-like mRNA interferase family n=1 Tax=Moraxella cuniculi DSM 21768 TaxID=1122245 RepID=A0A1N7DNX8_9GAMM|nr:type II toxin-antitoxin system HicA family toxin [Moraxella cuniculi]SIR77566.1 Predicted RNA binding protein YcfA, dsRBD-like fold, HicA-like mRNA interferase family [Moraxella cuniculi DSM 21768]